MKRFARSWELTLLAATGTLLGSVEAFAQSVPADSSSQATEQLQEVVVNGLRASVEKAQEIKRLAPVVVEAITSVDLGRFSDSSVADALGRVPGIQIDKTDGPGDLDAVSASGDRISIRGLGPQYIQTTVNGRPTLSLGNIGFSSGNSGGSRAFNFDTIPSEMLSGVLVYKTSNAALLEPGMAGAVDVRTLRPLDYHGQGWSNFFGSATATETYDNEAGKWGPRFSGLLGGKFLNGTLGIVVAALHSDERHTENKIFPYTNFENINVENSSGVVTPITNVYVPDQFVVQSDRREDERNVFSLDAQWRPNSQLEANVDFTHSRYFVGGDYPAILIGINDQYQSLPRVFGPGGVIVNNGALVYENTADIVSGGVGDGEPAGQLSEYHNGVLQNEYMGGLNVGWYGDHQSLVFDYGHSYMLGQSEFRSFYATNDAAVAAGSTIPELIYDGTGGGLPKITMGPQFGDLADYAFKGLYVQQNQYKGSLDSFKLDFTSDLSAAVKLRAGVSYIKSSHEFLTAQGGPGSVPQAAAGYFPGGTFSVLGINGIPLTSDAGGCAAAAPICSTVSDFGRGSFVGGFTTNPYGSPNDALPLGVASNLLREKNLGLYTEADFKTTVFGMNLSGNGGLRAVNIHEQGTGISGVTPLVSPSNNIASPINPAQHLISSDTYSYWRYLPSFNLTLAPWKNTNLRFGVAKTISLPDYGTLTAGYQITAYDNGGLGYANGLSKSGLSNIHLNPTQAWNYDVTLERYFDYGGAVIASLFYKKIDDFINSVSVVGSIPQYPGLFETTYEINSQSGRADGFELGTNQPFTFLPSPWDGFGVQGNYTYVDGHFDADPVVGAPAGGFPGASKNNFNVIGYYEKYGFEARIASTYRSTYVSTLGTEGTGTYTKAMQTLDASLSYQINTHVQIVVTGSNLTNAVREIRYQGGEIALYAQRPRTYSLSIRGVL
jgi:TonB-dependent receptor